ncbi:fatty acid alpha-dioxygenase [Marchantia polymorpha subsp. ruderalis]|uniref:Uncharacterized protein n=1 Tax=Marchantia polymorpha TaxID=3197 RepID=A0A2R6X7J4_MARPO|nr:hypothetical protein MARPO_0031s0055 [Marchantia polymorpha]BBN01025.1 hypothetical protein Mp_2g03990 [Marchantia polymorpha subsp. ruderalis]|eukprot:PTQ42074.1 hypothetical protein MARPO_0031s0055 [Marchantia polymorpha]
MGFLSSWISEELRPAYEKMPFGYKLCLLYVNLSDRHLKWYKVPVFLGLVYLELRRLLHQKYNLIAVGPPDEDSGDQYSFFGRNMDQQSQQDELLLPHPSVIATKLLNRTTFVGTGKQFNMLATSWINYMIKDWLDHMEDDSHQLLGITAPDSVAAECPLKTFKFYPTREFPIGEGRVGFKNTRTAWWDASAIYGQNTESQRSVRTFNDGKLKLGDGGLLEVDSRNIPITGDARNPWMGVSVLQSLFVSEHNLVCDTLKNAYPNLDDESLFQHGRLVVMAEAAKIHTIDWTTQLLKTNTLLAAMRANWYGLLGKWIKDHIGKTSIALLSGIAGAPKPIDHGVPYSLTEEFTSVYRMHPLLPEKIEFRDIQKCLPKDSEPSILEEVPMLELIGAPGLQKAKLLGMKTALTSLGLQPSGALNLFNYPTWMRNLPVTNDDGTYRKEHVDLPAIETFRDRSRRVARYNQFRRSMLMPAIKKWEDLTDEAATIEVIKEVYGDDVEKLDLLVGLLGEKKIPGFAISETAFFIFVLMATRRLESDARFTSRFNEENYTKIGLQWVNKTEGLKDVVQRHYPDIVTNWMTASSAFSIWSAPADKWNPVPLYLRLP